MVIVRWDTLFAALILFIGSSPVVGQSPLEELEAKLQGKIPSGKSDDKKSAEIKEPFEEALPLPTPKKESKGVQLKGYGPVTAPAPQVVEATEQPAAEIDPPYLGLTLERPTNGETGLEVVEVNEQSPAWKSGFRVSDYVLAIGGKAISSIDGFADEIARYQSNQPITFLVDRRGRQLELIAIMLPRSLALNQRPSTSAPSAWSNRTAPPLPRNPTTPRTPTVADGRGSIGLFLAPLSDAFRRQFGIPVYRGASVLEVTKDSPGFAAGLAAGDCIVEIDGKAILSDEDVVAWKRTAAPGSLGSVVFYRGAGRMQTVLQVPVDVTSESYRAIDPSQVTPEMLTPEYVATLQQQLFEVRAELQKSQEEVDRLQRRLLGK